MKYQLGGKLGSDFATKLACQTEILGQDGQVDAIWTAKRHQVGTQKGFGGSQGGSKRAKKGTRDIDGAARCLSNGGPGVPQSILAS